MYNLSRIRVNNAWQEKNGREFFRASFGMRSGFQRFTFGNKIDKIHIY